VTYVINEPCIGTKDYSCVEVCPVDCIHPTQDEPGFAEAEQLYIDPAECIDCDACVEACPVDAITPEDQVPPEWQHYIEKNACGVRFLGRVLAWGVSGLYGRVGSRALSTMGGRSLLASFL
jgi:NAD-dependent dihydropyrimidine dehydrogenase PreA subunit